MAILPQPLIMNALIVCTLGQVREDLPDLGYLDPGADCKDLKRGTKYISSHFETC